MKIKIYVLGAAILAFVLFVRATQNLGGAPNGNTGAPGETNCTACHGGAPNSNEDGSIVIFVTHDGNAVTQYENGKTYDVSVTVAHSESNKFGFQLTALNSAGNSEVGSVTYGSDIELTEDSGKNRVYLNHKAGSTTGTGNTRTWTFQWSPIEGVSGPITFYAAGNAANGDGGFSGDLIYTTSLELPQGTVSRKPVLSADVFRVLTGAGGTMAEITVQAPTAGTLALTDAAGRTIWSRNLELPAGTTTLPVEAPAGVYALSIVTAEGAGVRKFVRR